VALKVAPKEDGQGCRLHRPLGRRQRPRPRYARGGGRLHPGGGGESAVAKGVPGLQGGGPWCTDSAVCVGSLRFRLGSIVLRPR